MKECSGELIVNYYPFYGIHTDAPHYMILLKGNTPKIPDYTNQVTVYAKCYPESNGKYLYKIVYTENYTLGCPVINIYSSNNEFILGFLDKYPLKSLKINENVFNLLKYVKERY